MEEVVSEKKKLKINGRTVSQKTKDSCNKKRVQEFEKVKPTAKTRKEWNKKINRSSEHKSLNNY